MFFPSLDGSPQTAGILEGCGPYPLILFAHGQCEMDSEHYKKWFLLPATLARAGNVVVVPEVPHAAYPPNNDTDLDRMRRIVTWMRRCWSYRNVLLPPPATGVAGHSWGAMLMARFAADQDVSAFAALSGSWGEFQDSLAPLTGLELPTLFTWGDGGFDVHSTVPNGQWASLSEPKHKATFDGGEHWDYLPPGQTRCEMFRGSCDLTHWLAADLLTMFFGKYVGREGSPAISQIPANLVPPDLTLSTEQEFFAGGYLQGFSFLENDADCGVTLTWETDTESGTSTVPE